MARRDLLAILGGLFAALFGARRGDAQEAPPAVQLAGRAGQPSAEAQATRERMLAAIPYPRVETTGVRALAEWQRLRDEGKGWPVIVGDDEQLEAIAEQFSIDDPAVFPLPAGSGVAYPPLRSAAEILAAAGRVKLPGDLRAIFDEEHGEDEEWEPPVGEWPAPGTSAGAGLTVASDLLSGAPFARVHILLLPTGDGAEVPAYLRWGGWNACPPPEIHVALLRDWKRRYGAELVGINRDTINLRVSRRPATRDEALALAREQYLYCEDIVVQGVGTFAALGATLMEGDWWFFWWD